MAQQHAIYQDPHTQRLHRTRNRLLLAAAMICVLFLITLGLTAEYLARHAGPLLRSSVIATLSDRFHSPVDLDALDISMTNGIQVHGRGLRILYLAGPTQPDAKQQHGTAVTPMLSVSDFTFRTSLHDLFQRRIHIPRVDLEGMELHIPPHEGTQILQLHPPTSRITLTVDKISCTNVKLVIENATPGKDPLNFDIQHLELTDAAPGLPIQYVADLTNPRPVGDIHASGHFGPWQPADPRATPIDGHYTFNNVQLNTIKGLGGTLSSTGQFQGLLSHITVDGTTSTPDFSLDVSAHPAPLSTTFHAFVNGTTSDTTLDPVQATLFHSTFTCRGTVMHVPGKGHDIALNVTMPHGRIEDLLQLATRTQPPTMRGAITLQASLHIPPGEVRVAQKLQLSGSLHMQNVDFSNPKLQQQVDALSLRAQGQPDQAKTITLAPPPPIASDMAVTFALSNALLLVRSLDFQVPGANVHLVGVYPLDNSAYEFRGHVRTAATASQMVTGWKALLLKPFDGLLKKNGAGLDLPLDITGSHGDYKIGFALHGPNETPEQIEADIKARRQAATFLPG